ncbi:MAG TPA: carboxyl transferase domain-containing protein [Ramlibacter sp.]|uniref:acyl-CoA carboxylase subunit beta n=1 Tax=Ramlibacter sp. TaxID=1917967 RepID=UPI002D80010C|nr:carboxyl transferase domain-containing protein [Ramlibacter sp.]HET8744402.1 carboxyl transferase domain-containing protein [Ramlibacter sp.]
MTGTAFRSGWDPQSPLAQQRREAMLQRVAQWRALEQRAADKSAEARAVFERRGQLLPRERVGLLLDPGRPFLPLCSLAGYLQDQKDPAASVPGGGMLAGIGFVSGVRCMVVASDSGIDAGAIQPMGLDKILRVQEIALAHKLPFLHLVESAGANLMRYRVETFVQGGALFRNLALLSAAGIPVITVQHGSGTAGGAYMPGLSDIVIMVRGRSRAFLAGPPLLKAATGEEAIEEELGGAEMHTQVSGLGEYLAEDDRHALGLAREVLARSGWQQVAPQPQAAPPKLESDPNKEELLTLMPANLREPVDLREVMVRLVDEGALLEFKPAYGAATVCAQGRLAGHEVGFIANNGPIDVAGANKATHFIHWMCQLGHPIVYLQNTTGYIVGRQSEQDGMIKHGSKMIQAVTNANVPQLTIQCGASYGAGNYGMCGRAYAPRFLFSWPSARTAVMGGEQAARTMQIVTEAAAARKGTAADPAQLQAQSERIVQMFEAQADAFHTSGLLLDDGVIDPRDTRAVLAFCLDTIAEAAARPLRPVQFGVARM